MGCLGREASEKTVPEVEKRTEFKRKILLECMIRKKGDDEPRASGN